MCEIVRNQTILVCIAMPYGLFWEVSGNLRSAFGEES